MKGLGIVLAVAGSLLMLVMLYMGFTRVRLPHHFYPLLILGLVVAIVGALIARKADQG